jgi:hypothetical protein
MSEHSTLSSELAFLDAYRESDEPRYRSAPWLQSGFDAPVWHIHADPTLKVDWRIKLGSSASVLTDQPNRDLLETFKSWLIVQTHADWTGRLMLAPRTELAAIRRALHCIDYFLLRAEEFQLAEHGMRAVTSNDLKALIAAISSQGSVSTSVYQWPQALSAHLRHGMESIRDDELSALLRDRPFIAEHLPCATDRVTDLSDVELVRARGWLWKTGRYQSRSSVHGFHMGVNSEEFARALYANTLVGPNCGHRAPIELGLMPGHGAYTEFPRAPVTTKSDGMVRQGLARYFESITSMELLGHAGLQVPLFQQQDLIDFKRSLAAKQCRRFRTLPQQVVFPALRSALEFGLTYADPIIESYLNLAKAAREVDQPIGVYSHRNDIRPHLHKDAVLLGVSRWSIEWSVMPGTQPDAVRLSTKEFYAQLRANVGLWECIRVLYGAIQVVVGTLMARRSGELRDLIAGNCLDISRSHLIFRNRKSGIGGFRELEARPIPGVGAELIGQLERLQLGLIDIGVLAAPTNLFAPPVFTRTGLVRRMLANYYNDSLDYFCDWAELPLDAEGRRYYCRQHQLRRFFCMLFFWGGSFGGVETLRWFVGHTDAAHLWHYITESTPGLAVRSVAANWAAYGAVHRTPEAEALSDVLRDHFGTMDFEILDAQVLEDYIESLIAAGEVTVEPHFFDSGRSYRIAVTVRSLETTR